MDVLRSCHRSRWRFFERALNVITRGRFYFLDEDATPLPFFHDFYSATWTNGDDRPALTHGPIQDDARPWVNGALMFDAPPPIPYGTGPQFNGGLTYPGDIATGQQRAGIPALCWTGPRFAFLPWDVVNNIGHCQIRLAYARIIDLLYAGDETTIADFIHDWLGDGATVFYIEGAGNLPTRCYVVTAQYVLVFVSGTANFQQLALQALNGLSGPQDFGGYGTTPFWQDVSTAIVEDLAAIGVADPLPVLFAGHSMGGAGSAITCVRLRIAAPNRQLRLLTFGMPKPGDSRVRDALNRVPSVHVADVGDPTPHMPPTAAELVPLGGLVGAALRQAWGEWVAMPEYLQLDRNGGIVTGPLPPMSTNVVLPYVLAALFDVPIPPIEAHRITESIRRLELICGNAAWPFEEPVWEELFPDLPPGLVMGDLPPQGSIGLSALLLPARCWPCYPGTGNPPVLSAHVVMDSIPGIPDVDFTLAIAPVDPDNPECVWSGSTIIGNFSFGFTIRGFAPGTPGFASVELLAIEIVPPFRQWDGLNLSDDTFLVCSPFHLFGVGVYVIFPLGGGGGFSFEVVPLV